MKFEKPSGEKVGVDNIVRRFYKKRNKVVNLINSLEPKYDLPEHPDRMNGFENTQKIAEQIMAELGITKPKNA